MINKINLSRYVLQTEAGKHAQILYPFLMLLQLESILNNGLLLLLSEGFLEHVKFLLFLLFFFRADLRVRDCK